MSNEQMDLPPLFDKRGRWVGYDADTLAKLSPERAQIYSELEAVALALSECEAGIKATENEIAEHNRVAVEWSNSLRALQSTHYDLWKENRFTGGRRGRPA